MACSKKRIADLYKYLQINNKTIIKFGSRRYEELLRPRLVLSDDTNLCFNNSSYPALPHSVIVYYYSLRVRCPF